MGNDPEYPQQDIPDPKPLDELISDPSAVVGFPGDPGRQHEADLSFAHFEVEALATERQAILDSMESDAANDTPEARSRLEELNNMLLSAQADRTDIERNPPGTERDK